MAVIRMTPEVLHSKATEVRTLKGQHDEAITKLRSLIRSLDEIWEGDGHKAYVEEFEKMKPTFDRFSEMMDTYAKLLDSSATKIQDTDEEIKADAKKAFN